MARSRSYHIHLSEKEINRFVGEKADWIDLHLKKMKERQEVLSEDQSKALSEQEIRLLTALLTICMRQR